MNQEKPIIPVSFYAPSRSFVFYCVISAIWLLVILCFQIIKYKGFTDFLQSFILFVMIAPGALIGAYMSTRQPLIEITTEAIRCRADDQTKFSEINLQDIAGIEWPGYDNIGIKLKSGEVASISVIQLPKKQQEKAMQALSVIVANAAHNNSLK